MTLPHFHLAVRSKPAKSNVHTALLGRDIRSKPEEIARYCLSDYRGVMEDVATIAESVALADRIFPRQRGKVWSRKIELQIPVFEFGTFQNSRILASLTNAIHFLTGDTWLISFAKRSDQPLSQRMLPFEGMKYRYVTPYSDGLDSFAQTRLLEKEAGAGSVLKLRSARMGQDSAELQRPVLRVPRHLGSMHKPEKTYRSRPFVFFSFAAIGAFLADAEAVVVGESGQGALGPAMVRYADEWPFRSTHPGFASRLSRYLSLVFEKDIVFRLPQLWRTKGEVLRRLANEGLLRGWEHTKSCSVRPNNRHGAPSCGICGGCLLRSLAISSARIAAAEPDSAFSFTSSQAVAAGGHSMTLSERHMVVRSLGTMAEFARLAHGPQADLLIEAESILFDKPDSIDETAKNLRSLVARHQKEWHGFVDRFPEGGWAHEIVGKL